MPPKPLIILPDPQKGAQICDFLYQTAKVLAKQYEVVVIKEAEPKSLSEVLSNLFKKSENSIRKPQDITVIRPFFLIPFTRFSWITAVNYYLFELLFQLQLLLTRRQALFWFFFPSTYRFVLPAFQVHFDCVDIHTEHGQQPQPGGKTSRLLKRANTITSIARSQITFLQTLTNKPIYKTPQGFTTPTTTKPIKAEPKNKKTVFGFAGAISDRFDFSLLTSFIANNPKWQFEFWGPVTAYFEAQATLEKKVKNLAKLPNVSLKGSVSKEKMPEVLSRFDVGIIPYTTDQILNQYCYPMKLYEYYFAGKPVLSTPIQELTQHREFVYVGSTANEWQLQAKKILKTRWTKQKKEQQKQLALNNSWAKKVAIILKVIQIKSPEYI